MGLLDYLPVKLRQRPQMIKSRIGTTQDFRFNFRFAQIILIYETETTNWYFKTIYTKERTYIWAVQLKMENSGCALA